MHCPQPVMRFVCAVVMVFAPAQAAAQLEAHFEIESLYYHSSVDDCDYCLLCTPTCELYLQLGVFHGDRLQGSLIHIPGGCGFFDHEDGTWNIADQEIARGIPDLATYAHLYVALFDSDLDDDDLLGAHYKRFDGPAGSSSYLNNNYIAGGYSIAACDGSDFDSFAYANRFQIRHSVWFTDATPPVLNDEPSHYDSTSPTGQDDDSVLDFRWNSAWEYHSGVSEYQVELFRDQQLVGSRTISYPTTSVSACASGCDISHDVADGSSYELRLRARNGRVIDLQNQDYSPWSAWSDPVVVSFGPPVTTITGPPPGSWQNQSFQVSLTDTDVDLDICQLRVNGGAWVPRMCNDAETITVGATSGNHCQVEGTDSMDVCVIEGRSYDNLGHVSAIASASYGVDYTEVTVSGIEAFTEIGGTALADAAWTSDRDPAFSWAASESVSPLEGYSWAVDSDPDCAVMETSDVSVSLQTGTLDDGVHTFRLRAADVAGNCGPVASRTVQVDGTADSIDFLGAFTEDGGEVIHSGLAQEDTTPYLEWDASPSVAPIDGYSFGTGATVDCDTDATDTFTTLGPLGNGTTTFWVRVIDEAGNCGLESTFDIVVLVPETIFTGDFESGDTSAWTAAVP